MLATHAITLLVILVTINAIFLFIASMLVRSAQKKAKQGYANLFCLSAAILLSMWLPWGVVTAHSISHISWYTGFVQVFILAGFLFALRDDIREVISLTWLAVILLIPFISNGYLFVMSLHLL